VSPAVIIGLITSLVLINLGVNIEPSSTNSIVPKYAAGPIAPVQYMAGPTLIPNAVKLDTPASSAILHDVDSGVMLYQKSANERRPVASIAKLMTALVIMDNHSPDEIVKIGEIPRLELDAQKIGITEGEEFKLEDLLKALLIYSANDVANALAIYDSGSIEKFASKMNLKSEEWGLENSNFVNPSGLDSTDQYSSAGDILTLSELLINNKIFSDIVATEYTNINNLSGKDYSLTTTNKLLGKNGVIGLKTGFTLIAGECLVALTQRDGHRVVSVVLDSPNRFQESKNMVDWAFNNYIWQ